MEPDNLRQLERYIEEKLGNFKSAQYWTVIKQQFGIEIPTFMSGDRCDVQVINDWTKILPSVEKIEDLQTHFYIWNQALKDSYLTMREYKVILSSLVPETLKTLILRSQNYEFLDLIMILGQFSTVSDLRSIIIDLTTKHFDSVSTMLSEVMPLIYNLGENRQELQSDLLSFILKANMQKFLVLDFEQFYSNDVTVPMILNFVSCHRETIDRHLKNKQRGKFLKKPQEIEPPKIEKDNQWGTKKKKCFKCGKYNHVRARCPN